MPRDSGTTLKIRYAKLRFTNNQVFVVSFENRKRKQHTVNRLVFRNIGFHQPIAFTANNMGQDLSEPVQSPSQVPSPSSSTTASSSSTSTSQQEPVVARHSSAATSVKEEQGSTNRRQQNVNEEVEEWKRRYKALNSQFSNVQQENYRLKKRVDELMKKNEELENRLRLSTDSGGANTNRNIQQPQQPQQPQQSQPISTASTSARASVSTEQPKEEETANRQRQREVEANEERERERERQRKEREEREEQERRRIQEEADRQYAMRLQQEMDRSENEHDPLATSRRRRIGAQEQRRRRPLSETSLPQSLLHRIVSSPILADNNNSENDEEESDDVHHGFGRLVTSMSTDDFMNEMLSRHHMSPPERQRQRQAQFLRSQPSLSTRRQILTTTTPTSPLVSNSPVASSSQFTRGRTHPFTRIITPSGLILVGVDSSDFGDNNSMRTSQHNRMPSYEDLLRLDERAVRVGVPEQRLSQFPTHVYRKRTTDTSTSTSTTMTQQEREQHEEGNKCMICFDEYEEGDRIRTIPCMHKFHARCIDRWFKEHHDCPICKFDVNES